MNRLFALQQALFQVIEAHQEIDRSRGEPLNWERMHMASCAKVGYMLARGRGLDPVLAACACAVHDYGRILTGVQEGHAEQGAEPVRTFLIKTGLFDREETDAITEAVRNHSKKGEKGTPLEELVKDADLMDYHSYGRDFSRRSQRERFLQIPEAQGW